MLVGGPDRPPSKRMLEQVRAEDRQRREVARANSGTSTSSNQQDEGYWSYMQRQVHERYASVPLLLVLQDLRRRCTYNLVSLLRTERLNIVGDSMDKLEESSASWAQDVSKFVSDQKRKAVMGGKHKTSYQYGLRLIGL